MMRSAILAVTVLFSTCAGLARAADNELSDQEKKDGWVLMFDGKSVDGWVCGSKPMPAKQVVDGTLNTGKQGAYVSHFNRKFGDFHFACDFKFGPKTNSGIFLRIGKPGDGGIGRGFEVQVFDSFGKEKPTVHDCGALYELKAPSKNVVKPAGEWNHCEVVCQGSKVKVMLNGEWIIDADFDQWDKPNLNPDGSRHKFKWAFKDAPREGYIGLSDHGADCFYKNIKVKPLGEAGAAGK
jgi:hypothetical protein